MRRLLVILAVVVIVAGVAAGAPSWAQKGPIKVGMLVPQTGPLAANGKDMINGFELFFEERSEEHTSELQSRPHLVCRLLLEKKNSPCAFLFWMKSKHPAIFSRWLYSQRLNP